MSKFRNRTQIVYVLHFCKILLTTLTDDQTDVDVVDKIIMGSVDDTDDDADTLVIDIGNLDGFFDDVGGGNNSSKDSKAGTKGEISGKKAAEVKFPVQF